MTRAELRQFLKENLLQEYPPEEADIDQELLALLDLVPSDTDLFNLYLDLYTEAVAGLYDETTHQLYVIAGEEHLGAVEKVTFAHEFTHALQDQYFDLGALIDIKDNSDRELAVLSLVEGDAATVDSLYATTHLTPQEFQELLTSGGLLEVYLSAPLYIQQLLVFPYIAGGQFLAALRAAGGWERVNQAMQDPPLSTAQILHPEQYLEERTDPVEVVLPDLEASLGGEWQLLERDTLGELTLRLHLQAHLPLNGARTAAAGWAGDRLGFLKDTAGRHLLVLLTTWANEVEAGEFFQSYLDFLEYKGSSEWTLLEEDEGTHFWETPDRHVYLSRVQDRVLLVLAPDRATTEAVTALLPGL